MARYVIEAFRVPTRRACGVVRCNRATFYYRAQRRDVTPVRHRLRELATARPRFGYRRLHILLRREGWGLNHKKTYRLYREEGLGVRVRRRTKRASHLRVRPTPPSRPNERWCMDFMADRLDDGRRIRILTVEDVFTRECLAVEVLTRLVVARGAPTVITVDNGSEFYSRTTDGWAYQQGVRLDFSRPGKPMGLNRGKLGVVCVKRRAGRGYSTPCLVVMTQRVWEQLVSKMEKVLTVKEAAELLGCSEARGSENGHIREGYPS
jgi:putative transposase